MNTIKSLIITSTSALALTLTTAASTRATLIISNIPGTVSTPDGETGISQGFEFPARMRGIAFTTGSVPIHLTSIDYVVHDHGDGPTPSIYTDNAGQPGSAVGLPASLGRTNLGWGSFERYRFSYADGVSTTLNANTTYWLVGRVSGAFSRYHWQGFNTTASSGGWASMGTSVKDSTNGGVAWGAPVDGLHNMFEINGTLLPEPTSLGFLGLGSLALLRRKRPN